LRGGDIELFTSRWASKDLAHRACQPVGISRGTPKFRTGYRYKLARELAPSREAFGLADPQEFEAAYRAGLEEIGLDAILGKLEGISKESGGLPLVLLCFEALPANCHRGLLAKWLREHGVEIRELAPGEILQHENVAEPRLFSGF